MISYPMNGISVLAGLCGAVALASCGGSTEPGNGGGGNGGGGADAEAIVVVSGDAQEAKTGMSATEDLVVRVEDADGTPVSGANVTWTISSGPGSVSPTTMTTDAEGRASSRFTAGSTVGSSVVRASVSGVSTPAEFLIETTTVVVNLLGLAFVAPNGSNAVTVPVGTTVEWSNRDNVNHTATSSAEPAGGAPFNTGIITPGSRRTFTPQVEGTWTYFCEVHPGIMVGATITATAASDG